MNPYKTAVMLAGAALFNGGFPSIDLPKKEKQSDESKEYYLKRAEEKRKRKALRRTP